MYRIDVLIVVLAGGVLLLGGGAEAYGQDDPEPLRAVGTLDVAETSPTVMQAARSDVFGPDGGGKDGRLASVGMELAVLYHQHRVEGPKGIRSLRDASERPPKAAEGDWETARAGHVHSPLSADGRLVTVDAVAAEGASRLLADLRRLGLEDGTAAGNVVSGRLPISAIEEAAALSSLRGMMPSYARTFAGSVESEADTAHRAVEARATLGVSGSGQKVCALSDSYDNADVSISASDDVSSGDLPGQGNPEGRTTPVDALDDSYNGTDPEPSDEGRAMLQLIHDIAPGATLGFHTAFGGIGTFVSGIQELADAGCTVIVDDVRYFVEPFYQDGPMSNAIDDVVNNDGVAYFSSAGNNGQDSYEASFRDSGEPGVISSSSIAHDFDSDAVNSDTRQEITIEDGGTFQVNLQWTDPSALVQGSSGADTDFDIALVDENDNIVAQSANDNITDGVPFEFFEYTNDGSSAETLFLVIERADENGTDTDRIKYVYSGSDFSINEYDTDGPTIFGHAMAEGALATAAAPFFNTAQYNSGIDSSAILEFFSSRGGLEIRFDQNGDPLDSPESREKPDVTGTDFIDNTFFGNDIQIADPDPFPNFFGTSAAAPNIAAVAALIREAAPGLTPTQVYDRLESTAVDIRFRQQLENGSISDELDPTGDGVDPWSGHGFVRADRAVPAPAGVRIANESANVPSTDQRAVEVMWEKIGTESVDEFLLERRFFDGAFMEQERITAGGGPRFARTIEDLPIGEHTFRITALRNDSTLRVARTSAVVRENGVNASVFPNPFNGPANLSVTLPDAQENEQRITVKVFDILGRQVATPIAGEQIRRSGSTSFSLNSAQIRSLGSGVYFFRVRGDDFVATTRAVRVR